MSERFGLEPQPRETSMLDICNQAFDKASAKQKGYDLSSSEESLGLVHEQVDYTVPYGNDTDSRVKVMIKRPSVDTEDFLRLAEGTVDEKPTVEIWVHAPRAFLFNLQGGEKYFADKGFFRVIVLSDGTYLDIFSIAFKRLDDAGVERAVPDTVGSMLKPLPVETDWVIQGIIEPK